MANNVNILGFIETLAVFINSKEVKIKKVKNAEVKQLTKTNLSWAKKYLIQVYDFKII